MKSKRIWFFLLTIFLMSCAIRKVYCANREDTPIHNTHLLPSSSEDVEKLTVKELEEKLMNLSKRATRIQELINLASSREDVEKHIQEILYITNKIELYSEILNKKNRLASNSTNEIENHINENLSYFSELNSFEKAKYLNEHVLKDKNKAEKTKLLIELIKKDGSLHLDNFLFHWLLLIDKEKGLAIINECLYEKHGATCLENVLSQENLFQEQHKERLWTLLLEGATEIKELSIDRLIELNKSPDAKIQFANKLYKHHRKIIYKNSQLTKSRTLVSRIVATFMLNPIGTSPFLYLDILENSNDLDIEAFCLIALHQIIFSEQTKNKDIIAIKKKLTQLKKENLLSNQNTIELVDSILEK